MRFARPWQYLSTCLLVGGAALCVSPAMALTPAYGPGGYPNDPFGDVTGPSGTPDGIVTTLDRQALLDYISNPSAFSAALQERIRRYGDVSGVENRSTVGNAFLDVQDSYRHVLLAGGLVDAGTAGPTHPNYGDVNGDGKADIVDAVLVHRSVNHIPAPVADQVNVYARGGGDISPTVPYINFGDGAITVDDAGVLYSRTSGTEAPPPAYVDYFPLHVATVDHPEVLPDRYTMTDVNGQSGDAMHQIHYLVDHVGEVRGYTVTEVKGDDGSVAGFYKGIDGSLYIVYLQYPAAFQGRRLEFQTPIKLIDASKVSVGDTYSGEVTSMEPSLGPRPTPYKVTVLGRGDVTTPASGTYTPWSKTLQLRLDIALLKGPQSSLEMQQAFFYDFEPFIGLVRRGQATYMGSSAPESAKPLVVLDSARVRGLTYSQTKP